MQKQDVLIAFVLQNFSLMIFHYFGVFVLCNSWFVDEEKSKKNLLSRTFSRSKSPCQLVRLNCKDFTQNMRDIMN